VADSSGVEGISLKGPVDGLSSLRLRTGSTLGRVELEDSAKTRSEQRRTFVRQTLLTADIVALLATYVVTIFSYDAAPRDMIGFFVALPVLLAGATICRLYDPDDQGAGHSTLDDIGRIFQLTTVATWGSVVSLWFLTGAVELPTTLFFWGVTMLFLTGGRAIARIAVRHHLGFLQNTLIVGAGDVGQLIGRKLIQHPEFGLRLVGFVDSEPKEIRGDLEVLPVLGSPDEIERLVRGHDIDRVIVAFSNDRHDLLVDLVRSLHALNVRIDLVPRLFEAVGPIAGVHLVEGFPLVGLPVVQPSRLARRVKRALDIAIAATALMLLSPLFAWIAWRVRRDSPGPALFRQLRLGEGQQPITLLKFRTMSSNADDTPHREYVRKIMDVGVMPTDNHLYKLERPKDVTNFGTWLRRTSLDELPQLINVLRGDMSLVGPRPCMSYETELFDPYHFDRFLVPAGMTGLWQVVARAHATFKEALDLDVAYARNWSLRLDLALLARTPLALLRGGNTT
jgi:exopolysaccharide biosynthesis polyprenyl glycosylphosphotransferase